MNCPSCYAPSVERYQVDGKWYLRCPSCEQNFDAAEYDTAEAEKGKAKEENHGHETPLAGKILSTVIGLIALAFLAFALIRDVGARMREVVAAQPRPIATQRPYVAPTQAQPTMAAWEWPTARPSPTQAEYIPPTATSVPAIAPTPTVDPAVAEARRQAEIRRIERQAEARRIIDGFWFALNRAFIIFLWFLMFLAIILAFLGGWLLAAKINNEIERRKLLKAEIAKAARPAPAPVEVQPAKLEIEFQSTQPGGYVAVDWASAPVSPEQLREVARLITEEHQPYTQAAMCGVGKGKPLSRGNPATGNTGSFGRLGAWMLKPRGSINEPIMAQDANGEYTILHPEFFEYVLKR